MSPIVDEPRRPSRRRFLRRALAGGFLAASPPLLRVLHAGTSSSAPPDGKPPSASGGAGSRSDAARIREISEMLRTTPRERVFDAAAEHVRRGATMREMLGGVLLAGARDVRPWPPGVKFHTVLMVPSVLALAEASDPEDGWLGVFFNINVLKEAQERDAREGDWSLPPEPAPLDADPDRALRSLGEALERWDIEAADRAVTAAARRASTDDLFEVLWPYGARDWANIGHLMIHTSQTHRSFSFLEGEHRVTAARSLVHGLLGGRAGRTTASFDRSRSRVGEMPSAWESARGDPEISLEVLRGMRTAGPDEAADLVLSLVKRGAAPASIWDGLRLCGAEILHRLSGSSTSDAQLLGVHPTTILNAFAYASRTSGRDGTRRLLLPQAAAWIASARDVLRDLKGLSMEGPGIDRLDAPAGPVAVEKVLEEAARSRSRAAILAFASAKEPERGDALISGYRSLTLRKAPEHHHHKYAAALFEDFPRTDPRWRPHLLAVAPTYLAHPAEKDSDPVLRARAALSRSA